MKSVIGTIFLFLLLAPFLAFAVTFTTLAVGGLVSEAVRALRSLEW